MSLDDQIGVVQDGKAIHNVGAHGRVNVLRLVLANTWTVPGPVGEVTNNLRGENVKEPFFSCVPVH